MTIHIPTSDGHWSGTPGNSIWFPYLSVVPSGSNDPVHPYTFKGLLLLRLRQALDLPGLSILRKTIVKTNIALLAAGMHGIRFYNGEPDFAPFAIATVKLGSYLDSRYGSAGTMTQADKLLAQKCGIAVSVVRQWINDRQYVWHERQNGRHIDLVCHDIHSNIPHSGGIAANKQRLNSRAK